MPEQQTLRRARQDLKEGKSPSTAAGKFVHEETTIYDRLNELVPAPPEVDM